jgi:hypothetical protein
MPFSILRPCSEANFLEPLKSMVPICLLTAFSVVLSDSSHAVSKPAIEVHFELEKDLFLFNELYNDKEQEFIRLVCEESKKKWGFLEWCPSLDSNASRGDESVSRTGDDAPQAVDASPSVSDQTSVEVKPVWIIKVETDPQKKGSMPGAIVLKHYLKFNSNEIDLGESVELYGPTSPKTLRDPRGLGIDIRAALDDSFGKGTEWTDGIRLIKKTIPITNDLRFDDFYVDKNGLKFIPIPYALCDLGLVKKARFRVELVDTESDEQYFDIKKYGSINDIDPADRLMYGTLEDWNLFFPDLEPKPHGPIKHNEQAIKNLLTNKRVKVFMHEDSLDIGASCEMNDGLATSGPYLNFYGRRSYGYRGILRDE